MREILGILDRYKYYGYGKKYIFHGQNDHNIRRSFIVNQMLGQDTAFNVLRCWDEMVQAGSIEPLYTTHQNAIVSNRFKIALNDQTFIPKIYVVKSLSRRLIALTFHSAAHRNFSTCIYLNDNRIHVPLPLAVLDEYKTGILMTSVLFMKKLPEQLIPYKQYAKDLNALPQNIQEQFLSEVGHSLGRLHNLGVYTEDTDKNMMVGYMEGVFDFYYYDFDNYYPWRIPNYRRSNHAVCRFLSQRIYPFIHNQSKIFIKAYVQERKKPTWEERLVKSWEERLVRYF